MKYTVYTSAVRKLRRRVSGSWGKKRKRIAAELTAFIHKHQQSALDDWYNNHRSA